MYVLNGSKEMESQLLNYLAVDVAENILNFPAQKDIEVIEMILANYRGILCGNAIMLPHNN